MWKFLTLLAVVGAVSEKPVLVDKDVSIKDLKNPLTLISDLKETASRLDDDRKSGGISSGIPDKIGNSQDRPSGSTSNFGSSSGNSVIFSKYRLKKKCREVYGDDFEKKWDCIRSGTAPPQRPQRPIFTTSATARPSIIPLPDWNESGEDHFGGEHHSGEHHRPSTRRTTDRPSKFPGWHRPGDDDDDDSNEHHSGEQHSNEHHILGPPWSTAA